MLVVLLPLSIYGAYAYVSVAEKHKILEEVFNDIGFNQYQICSSTSKIDVFEDNLDEFSLLDQPSVYIQKLFQKSSLDGKFLSELKLVQSCNMKTGFIYYVSLPIVSLDKQTVLIKITEDCNCMLGGYGGEFVFRKINGKWTEINSFNYWIG